ncbi:MAG: antirestriction protein [Pseudomonadota bacterium]
MLCTTPIACQRLSDGKRRSHTSRVFGIHFPLLIEPFIHAVAESLSPEYEDGDWTFYRLSNGAFYMAPLSDKYFPVVGLNGHEDILSADALGITACLYAYSHLSFLDNQALAETCAEHYHLLRDYMLEQTEAEGILGAID